MRHILVIGIGAGNPEHVTIEAIGALNSADLVLVPRKGPEKSDLADLRREICARYLTNPATRLVEFDMPVRDAGGDYHGGVEAWHREIAARYATLIEAEAGPEAVVALLVWGDPMLYDSSLRILDHLAAQGLGFTRRVIPGITSLQALCARHATTLNTIGGTVTLTTGRRLRAAVPEAETIAVMLDGGTAFESVPWEGMTILWGAYLGMPEEILIAGPLAEAGPRIATARAEARAAHGWIMDTYLLRRD